MHEISPLRCVCLTIHVSIRQRIFVKMSSALNGSASISALHGQKGSINTLHSEEVLSVRTSSPPHDSVVMIPVASGGQELPETSHFSLAGSELGSVLMRSETMSSGRVCHYFTWQSGSTKTQIMEENDSTYITMPPDETLIKHFWFSQSSIYTPDSKKPNCLTSKSEEKFPLRKGLVISAYAPDSSFVLIRQVLCRM